MWVKLLPTLPARKEGLGSLNAIVAQLDYQACLALKDIVIQEVIRVY